jgi:hypothetical protein
LNGAINRLQLFVGFTVLFLGVLYYYFFRTSQHTYFIQFLELNPPLKDIPSLFQKLGYSLPTFVHVFSFSLITAGLIASRKQGYAMACLFWLGINVLFELGQKFDSWVIQFIPGWFSNVSFLKNTKIYFLKGRFDYLDLFSITLGALVAYIFLIKTAHKEEKNEKQTINCR